MMSRLRLVWQLAAVAVVAFVGSQAVNAVEGSAFLTLVLGLLTSVLAVFVYGRAVRRTEGRPADEVALAGARPAVTRGTLIGLGLFTAVVANIALLGDYGIDGWGSLPGAVGLVGFMAAAAVTEELLFRGVLFRIIEERTGTWTALALTGGLFGLSHLFNENAGLWGAVAIAIEAGGMLAAAYAATRTLWLPIGLHFGWNFAESGIFSTEVSGNGSTHGLLESSLSGSVPVTGGAFGPEGSVYSVLFGLLTTIAFMWLAHRRGTVVPRRSRRAEQTPAVATLPR